MVAESRFRQACKRRKRYPVRKALAAIAVAAATSGFFGIAVMCALPAGATVAPAPTPTSTFGGFGGGSGGGGGAGGTW
jgi:hypothetical protein